MQSLWKEEEAAPLGGDRLGLRVYTSRLLGREPSLVLHGGGNTSVKLQQKNLFGKTEHVLYVKGSGWDLATIEKQGFAPVRMEVLLEMAKLEELGDAEMVRAQRGAMTDPGAPTPSIEAILHAIIPFAFVDHTHADVVVTLSNVAAGETRLRDLYGDRVLIVPYVMPGFALARRVYQATRDADWRRLEGMILMQHGVFSFGDDARESYERMIRLVSAAEDHLRRHGAWEPTFDRSATAEVDPRPLAALRRKVCAVTGSAVVARADDSPEALAFANLPDVASIATRGPLTPDHVIHTKRVPLVVSGDAEADVDRYARDYRAYVERHARSGLTCLDPAPRWAIWPGRGIVAFGPSAKRADVVVDIARHTARAVRWGEALGGWRALGESELFDIEYWELEQAKLRKGGPTPPLQGKIALVTGGANGIGRASAEMLRSHGAAVSVLDLDPKVATLFHGSDALGIVCDLTDRRAIDQSVAATVRRFGGLDVLVLNAGSFPPGKPLSELDDETWSRSVDINLTSHQRMLRACIPFLALGIDAAVVVVASRNVLAPGPGAAAYSAAKAGLTQLARVAALELSPQGIRVNVLHPDAVFDTGIWTPEVLEERARRYGLTVGEYKRRNLLQVEITSGDVAALVCALAGPLFSKTTGAQVPVDGGSDRVI
jgi:rhamnose utilization protein RhaD (predicted bifunctional aldolase and dehydrogenase)/NAD(P)-dependent dehydrogenase (short-subunit alcohol dehydrogenase family)